LGGPIQKDKTFLFGNYEGFEQHLGLTDVTLVPDNNARNGLLPVQMARCSRRSGARSCATAFVVARTKPERAGLRGIAESFSNLCRRFERTLEPPGSTTSSLRKTPSPRSTPSTTARITHPPSIPIARTWRASGNRSLASMKPTFLPHADQHRTLRFLSRQLFLYGRTNPQYPAASVPSFLVGRPVGAVVIGGSAASNPAAQLSLAGSNNGSNLDIARIFSPLRIG